MFRIHFTADDLIRIRFTATYGPLAETLFGVALAPRRPPTLLGDWQRRVLAERGHWGGPLAQVATFCGHVDLFTLAGAAPSLDEGLEALVAAKPDLVRAEVTATLNHLDRHARRLGRRDVVRPLWSDIGRRLPDDRITRQGLANALRGYAGAMVEPYWDSIRDHLAQEVTRRSQQLAATGLGKVLATLHPNLRWTSPVLEINWGRPYSGDLHLQGRGLELVPSLFYRETTPPYVSSGDPSAPPVLLYPLPIEPDLALRLLRAPASDSGGQALIDLLGRSRALVLRTLSVECGTTELARRTGLSLAGASQHAAVLRNAKLVVTRRIGGSVCHSLTALGHRLLEQS